MLKKDIHNAVFDIAGESIWGFQAAMIASATVLVVVLRHFGAGRAMIGSIASIETCAMLFPQIIGLTLFRSRARRKANIIAFHYVAMIPFLFFISWILHRSHLYTAEAVRVGVLIGWSLFVTSIGVVIAVWMDWIAGVFDQRSRGTVMGASFFGANALGAIGGILSGRLIGDGQSSDIFSSLYFWAAMIATIAMTAFWFIDDHVDTNLHPDQSTLSSVVGNFRSSLSDSNFRAFLIGRILATSGFCILPLVGDYFVSNDGGRITPGHLVTCGAAYTAGMGLSNLGLGRLGDRHGHRLGLMIGIATQIGALVLLLIAPGRLICLWVYLAAGICAGSAFLSHYNMVFETCPHDNRTAHITLANMILGAFTAMTPILAGVIAAHLGIRPVFDGSLLLSLLALLWFLLRVDEPRAATV